MHCPILNSSAKNSTKMRFSNSTSVLSLATFILCFLSVTEELYVDYACKLEHHNSNNDTFQTNLKELLSYLSYETPFTGFSLGSKGKGQDRVYGLALCHPGMSPTNCSICLAQAINDLGKRCQYYNGGVIWYDHCQLKYSNRDVFGKIDYKNWFCQHGNETGSDPASFDKKSMSLLRKLAEQASGDPEMSACGNVELEGSELLSGLLSAQGTLPKQIIGIVLQNQSQQFRITVLEKN